MRRVPDRNRHLCRFGRIESVRAYRPMHARAEANTVLGERCDQCDKLDQAEGISLCFVLFCIFANYLLGVL